ncbi:Ig-like domain-containing protein [Paenibacillus sp. LHD-38]|uniref:Ig-like domain-containing protein n=1 Tax=Paenibacillus sp. LHD-38 TaxID=3072143 RepID=UPI00280FE0A4|nr:Ig-like domain-containing protein [Paenibacillus sp. LHD-38]MDQ8735153.1 Ig-like domain-containing protein [Paenibacillus sp. LHD-38]
MRPNRWLQKGLAFCLMTAMLVTSFTLPAFARAAGDPAMTVLPVVDSTDSSTDFESERRMNFNDDWLFQRETSGSIVGAQAPGFDDSSWRQLNLPHDWSIELDFNANSPATHEGGFLDGGIGWYRKAFTIPSSMAGKRISIDFDGVYMNSTTYLNGQQIGTYPYGYNAFSYDITDKLYTDGRENVIAVKVNNTQPSSRWYSGSGIYRNVYLTVTNPVHVARYGTFVTTPNLEADYAEGRADVKIQTKVNNDSGKPAQVKVKSTIYAADGTAVSTVESNPATAASGKVTLFEDKAVIEHPTLWSIDNPYRYTLQSEVFVDEQLVDTYQTRFGARYFKLDNNEGFSLNGKYMKLHGASMHHDLGALGAATNARAVERQMQIMKDMGVNAIRVTHNPASPELLEAANQLGLLVIEEAFDAWNQSKKTYDYSRFFSSWAEHDVKEMVDRGKNEPSIIMWSLGNEIYDTTNANGVSTARNLVRWVKEVDTTRPTTIGEDKTRGDKVNVTPINSFVKEILDAVDVVGLNYSENNYAGYHAQNPSWKIYGAETSSATRSRGVYTHPYAYNQSTKYADMQQSSYDNDYVGWGRTAEDAWKWDRDLKHIAGQFIWTGFDYIGEPTPYYNAFPAKSSYFGAVDTAGFPKDIFYYYQSQWKAEPMVHLLPHWNWTEGQTVRVLAYSNAHKVELLLGGKSLGERSYVNKTTSWGAPYKETVEGKTYLEWAVPFQAGTLEAVAKDEAGKIIARDKVVTAGVPAALKLTADRHVITADGSDLSFITVDVVDSKGIIVPTADNLVNFTLSGGGKLAGVDNGNAASVERFKDNKRKAFSGKALAIIQSDNQAGEITLTAASSGLLGASTTVFTVPIPEDDQLMVAGIEGIHVTTGLNEQPVLPATVNVYYSNSSVSAKKVSWAAVDPSLYAKIGKFAIEGTVEGITEKAVANVTVMGIVAVKPVAIVTKVGVLPDLPSQVSLLYSDDSVKNVPVNWDAIPADKVNQAGSFIVEGNVSETAIRAKAAIRVTSESQQANIMLRKEGSLFPQLEATFTNPADNLAHINDGIKSYNDNPVNRWTNWTRTPRNEGDSITVDFGKAYSVNELDLFVFTDSGTVVPGTVTVQYWNGTAWADVKNQTNPSPYVVQKNVIRFDSVTTSKLKFHMTPSQAGKYVALTEVEIYADQIAMGATANLSGITVNGEALADFSATKHDYELALPYGSELPVVEAVGADHATVTILPALSFPGIAKIYVTSENGLVSSEYVIRTWMEEAKLISAKLEVEKTAIIADDVIDLKVSGLLENGDGVDLTGLNPTFAFDPNIVKIENGKLYALREGEVRVTATATYKGSTVTTPELLITIAKNTAEKVIESLEPVTVIVDRGIAPVLPETVVAHFKTGLPQNVNVTWGDIAPAQYAKLGEFGVLGVVAGTNIKAQAKVIVKGAVAVEQVSKAALRSQKPNLPATLTVYFSDGTTEQMAVVWADILAGSLESVGIFKLEGHVEGIELKAKASIRVTDQVGEQQNISRAKNGYEYPKAEASFTNRGAGSSDRIEAINDDVISYSAEPHNRWTNWQSVPRSGDWVSITFGDFEPTEYDVDNMEIHWFADSGTSYPASFKIQYKSGDSWVDVTHLRSEPSTPSLNKANNYTFDRIKTSALRVDMTAQTGKSLAITELKIVSKRPSANSEPSVSDIQLDGKSIIDGFVQTSGNYEYSALISSGSDIPQITAKGEGNSSVTIVPVVSAPSTAKVIVKSEDGKRTTVYNIHFSIEDDGTPQPLSMKLNGSGAVQSMQTFTVDLGLQHVTAPVQAQDIIVRYDADRFEFVKADSKLEHVKLIETVSGTSGQLRLIVVSEGAEHAIRSDGAIIEMTWRARATEQPASGKIETTQAIVSDSEGIETNAAHTSLTIDIAPISLPSNPDVNGDGKVSIGDLSIAAVHYGKDSTSPDWAQVKRADINGDGKIGIEDLAAIATKIALYDS